MTFDHALLHDISTRVVLHPDDPTTVAAAREVVRAGGSRPLAAEILAVLGLDRDDIAAIKKAMALFEAMAPIDFLVGGALMAELCTWAGPRFMHDVCDAVTLWMFASRSAELAALFGEAGSQEPDKYMRSRYEEWITGLTRRE